MTRWKIAKPNTYIHYYIDTHKEIIFHIGMQRNPTNNYIIYTTVRLGWEGVVVLYMSRRQRALCVRMTDPGRRRFTRSLIMLYIHNCSRLGEQSRGRKFYHLVIRAQRPVKSIAVIIIYLFEKFSRWNLYIINISRSTL